MDEVVRRLHVHGTVTYAVRLDSGSPLPSISIETTVGTG